MAKLVGSLVANWHMKLAQELAAARRAGLASAYPDPVGPISSWHLVGPKVGGSIYLETGSGTWRGDGDGRIWYVVSRGSSPSDDVLEPGPLRRNQFPARVLSATVATATGTADGNSTTTTDGSSTTTTTAGRSTLLRDLALGLAAAWLASKAL